MMLRFESLRTVHVGLVGKFIDFGDPEMVHLMMIFYTAILFSDLKC
jgi:hypothetical protein